MARKAVVYRVALATLVTLGYIREEIDNITGEVKHRPCGLLEDIIIGIGRQCDRLGDFDVKPGKLKQLAMIDGLTAQRIAQAYHMDERQARRYMAKLVRVQEAIEHRLPWFKYAYQREQLDGGF